MPVRHVWCRTLVVGDLILLHRQCTNAMCVCIPDVPVLAHLKKSSLALLSRSLACQYEWQIYLMCASHVTGNVRQCTQCWERKQVIVCFER